MQPATHRFLWLARRKARRPSHWQDYRYQSPFSRVGPHLRNHHDLPLRQIDTSSIWWAASAALFFVIRAAQTFGRYLALERKDAGRVVPQANVLEQRVNMKKQLVMALGFGLALAVSTASWAEAAGAGGSSAGGSVGGASGGSTGGAPSTAPAANVPSSAPSPNPSSPNTVPQSNETPVSPGSSSGTGTH